MFVSRCSLAASLLVLFVSSPLHAQPAPDAGQPVARHYRTLEAAAVSGVDPFQSSHPSAASEIRVISADEEGEVRSANWRLYLLVGLSLLGLSAVGLLLFKKRA